MSELCDCKCCDYQPILEKLTKDNLEKVIWHNGRQVLHRKHLTIYRAICTGKMKSKDGLWVKCVSYHPWNDYNTNYTRSIDSFIENFVPIVFKDFEERLFDERYHLQDKVIKLDNFISENPKFQELDGKDKELMEKQLAAMKLYYDFLNQRVNKMLKQKIEDYDALPLTGEEIKANLAGLSSVL